MSCTNLLDLPEECLSHILSLTSPADIVRSSAVSKLLLSASDSDFAWEKFMPSDTDRFVSQQSSTPFDQQKFASKRYLYFRLCSSPILLDHSYSKVITILPFWMIIYEFLIRLDIRISRCKKSMLYT